MLLRDLHPADLDEVHAINQAAVPAVGEETAVSLAHIASESAIALVAEVRSAIAGFCMVLAPDADYDSGNFLWFVDRYDDFIYLDRVAIAESHQRRGLGRALYAEVERLAGERCPSARHLTLEVNLRPRNDTSLAFHAELGFVEVGRRETDYGALVSMMTKALTPPSA